MGRNTTPTAEVPTVDVDKPATEDPTPTPPVKVDFDAMFADLPPAETAEFTRGPARVDIEAETPARVKTDLQNSFNEYKPDLDKDGNDTGKPGVSSWKSLPFPNADVLNAYVKLAKRYATFKEWTFRSGIESNGTTLRFAAKPKEVRAPRAKATDVPPVAPTKDAEAPTNEG